MSRVSSTSTVTEVEAALEKLSVEAQCEVCGVARIATVAGDPRDACGNR